MDQSEMRQNIYPTDTIHIIYVRVTDHIHRVYESRNISNGPTHRHSI